MVYDIILVIGEKFFDHPLSGPALIKRVLEKNGYSVAVIEMPKNENAITRYGAPRLYFGVSSGSIDSMLRNYTPLKKDRHGDPNFQSKEEDIPNRAVIVYCNWIKSHFKKATIVIGGIEATMRRFVHYDYWDNALRRPILFDARADILSFGCSEKQVVEIAERIKRGDTIDNIQGTAIIAGAPPENTQLLPSFDEIKREKNLFIEMQLAATADKNCAQQIDNRFMVQFSAPIFTSKDIDSYYELPFTRKVSDPSFLGFTFSIVTHRGCIGECSFCSLSHSQGNRIVSRSEESILREITAITRMKHFKGNIDDLGGPSANMYGMDCQKCKNGHCLKCRRLPAVNNSKIVALLQKARRINGVKKIIIRSGIRFDLANEEYIREITQYHLLDALRIAPEHINPSILKLMNKNYGNLQEFINLFNRIGKGRSLSFYFMAAHPGSTMKDATDLANYMGRFRNIESFQLFTPTPGTLSTCMYYTEMDPWNKTPIHVPKSYTEKKEQKRLILDKLKNKRSH